MKKVLLSLAVIFMMSSFTTVEKITFEEVGPAGDCVRWAREQAMFLAAAPGGSGDPMDYYMTLYMHCFYSIE
tara:strand:- start:526 stop:741 length:216 start_codon:yes stop_codon:yes gene_type:complete